MSLWVANKTSGTSDENLLSLKKGNWKHKMVTKIKASHAGTKVHLQSGGSGTRLRISIMSKSILMHNKINHCKAQTSYMIQKYLVVLKGGLRTKVLERCLERILFCFSFLFYSHLCLWLHFNSLLMFYFLHSQLSFIVRIVPSPDWFVGVDSIDLCDGDHWKENVSVDLFPYDAGTDSGFTFSSPNFETIPQDKITQVGSTGA